MTTVLDELIAYVELDESDRARLCALHDVLKPQFPAIAGRFYEAVWASPGAAAVLSGPEQVERLRVTLIDWMSTGLLGPYDDAFYDKRSRIGRRHVTIGLAQQYMFTSINVMRDAYLDRISQLYPPTQALLVIRSVDKLFDIELALMLRHYQLDSEEKLVSRERRIQADRITALQTMSAGLAHEVRNPLNAAKLQLELLDRRVRRQGDDPRLTEPAALANQEIARLTDLLNEFLSFARAPDLRPSEQDVVAIARQVIDLERALAEVHGTAVELAPGTEQAVVATVDPRKLHQVIQNLIRNGIEASGAKGRVTIGVTSDDTQFRIRVADNGPGIPEHVRTRIYEPFFSTKQGGTGLGMSIAHNFVTMHGGTIEIHSGPRGTLVEVTIPRAPATP